MKAESSSVGRRAVVVSQQDTDGSEEEEEMEMQGETFSPKGNKRVKRAVVEDDEEEADPAEEETDEEDADDDKDDADDAGLLPEQLPIIRDVDGSAFIRFPRLEG